MMSGEAIAALADEVGEWARNMELEPLVLDDEEQITNLRFSIPNLGSYRPDGWELVDSWLCDKTGLGSPSEPALTIAELTVKLIENKDEGYGYAMIEEGEFQVLLGVFKPES